MRRFKSLLNFEMSQFRYPKSKRLIGEWTVAKVDCWNMDFIFMKYLNPSIHEVNVRDSIFTYFPLHDPLKTEPVHYLLKDDLQGL